MRKLGIILAAGASSRLYPSTLVATKQLLPVYDKPLIYYPLSTLMLADIREFVIITSPGEHDTFKKLFADAESEMGVQITFLVQEQPVGIADAFKVVKNGLGDKVFEYDVHALVLGDNIFYGAGFTGHLQKIISDQANVFVSKVSDPTRFGIAEFLYGRVVSIEEKPTNPKSDLAITGLYFYPKDVYIYVEKLVPSARGELEITDLNKLYLMEGRLNGIPLSRGMVWFDTGTADSLLEAANFIQTIQRHQNYMIGSPHEIAIKKQWTSYHSVFPFINKCSKTEYGKYLQQLL